MDGFPGDCDGEILMIRKIAFSLVLLIVLLALHPMLSAGTIEEKDAADPVALLRKKHQDVREKELKDIDMLKNEVRVLETRIRNLNQRLLSIKGSQGTTPGMLDEMHDLVNQKEGLEKELKEKKKDLGGKEKDLEQEDAKRREEVESLKADLKKDERKQRSAALKKDLRKYEKIISSPSVENMNIKVSAWKALIAKYPEGAKDVAIGDTEELMFKVKYGGMTNFIGMRVVLIQAGQFRMGRPAQGSFRKKKETRP